MKKIKNFLREVLNLIVKFFRPFGITDEILAIPEKVKLMFIKVNCLEFVMTIVSLSFAFLLKATNVMIEHKLILLGIIFFMLFRGEQVVTEGLRVLFQSERNKSELIFNDEVIYRGSNIVGKTANRVLKYDAPNKLYKIMSNESVLNTLKNYLTNLWQQKVQHIFDVLEIVSVIVMLIVAILTNTSINQIVFVSLICIFVVIAFLTSAYSSLNVKEFYVKQKECINNRDLISNDLLRVPSIVNKDLDMRISRFQKIIASSHENTVKYYRKGNLSSLLISILEVFSQYGIIIFYLLGTDWNNISLSTITEISATLAIVQVALRRIRSISSTLSSHSQRIAILEKEEQDMRLILEVYYEETKKTSAPKIIKSISINPFSIRYLEESENDKPFTLISEKDIKINAGEIAILYGPSGSGKSTFMKMLTERIRLTKSTEIPSTSRFLFFDEKLRFGSLKIFEELFCCDENPDLAKMRKILENLHLWDEIKSNCIDVWKWMQEKQFEQSLSNGQKQRLILAKMLYWLDDEIDVLVLDECTSGLDDKADINSADAEKILEYIVRYANSDKPRIIIISTHQNIDGFKENLASEFTFRNLHFVKDGTRNLVKEI